MAASQNTVRNVKSEYILHYVMKVVLLGVATLFIMATLCTVASTSNTGINVTNAFSRQPYCSCNPVTKITPPTNNGIEVLASIYERLLNLTNKMHGLGAQVERKLKGMSAQMDRRLADLEKNRNSLKNILEDINATSSTCWTKLGEGTKSTLGIFTPINLTSAYYARPPDCATLQKAGAKTDGVYRIYLDDADKEGTLAYCDLTTDGGGWTVFQRRQDGSVNFYRKWEDYKKGFGYHHGEFWFGNENIHRLTHNSGNQLRIDLEDWGGNKRYASYGFFYIEGEQNYYRLTLMHYVGDAGDSLLQHNGKYFSTRDADRDANSGNCAVGNKGGWWYHGRTDVFSRPFRYSIKYNCAYSNLNGAYITANTRAAIWWNTFIGVGKSIKHVSMKIRPYGFTK